MTSFYHDVPSNTLIYPRHALITQTIPEAREINGQFVAVPRSLHNCQVLRHYNFPVAPIITDENYSWPRNTRAVPHPYESQKTTTNFFVLHPRCFCLTDMGGGKSLAAMWAADNLMNWYGPGFRALIVCPLSILQQWQNSIFEHFLGRRTAVILHGSAAKRIEMLKKPADFYLCNYDGLGVGAHTHKKFELDGFSKALAERQDIKLVIADEASAYKDAQTKRHRLARAIIGQRDYLWLMTGTPTPNAPTDAYGLAKMVNNAFGKSFTSFRLDTMQLVSLHTWKPYKDGYEKARRLLTPSIRFDIKEIWDGPEMTTEQRKVELTPDQNKLMADLKRDQTVAVKSGKQITAINAAAARSKFIQIALGAIYDENHKVHFIDAAPRIAELKNVLEQVNGKALVFAPLTSVVELLYKELKRNVSCEVVNGNTSQKDRARIFQAFQQESEPRVLIADPGCMAHGLNLWMATAVIWYGPCDKTEIYLQANKRAHRPGQKYPVTVVQLVSNKLEAGIFKTIENNTENQNFLLDLIGEDSL